MRKFSVEVKKRETVKGARAVTACPISCDITNCTGGPAEHARAKAARNPKADEHRQRLSPLSD
jgi:hypothetical protein